jgi:hypothetical protein
VDAWAGSPDSSRDRLCGGCRRLDRDATGGLRHDRHATGELRGIRTGAVSIGPRGSAVGPLLLGVALVLAPVVAAAEIVLR